MKTMSACFAGYTTSELPYEELSKEYEGLENVLKKEITRLMRLGVSEFYVGGQNGIDETCSLLVLYLKEHIGATANLNLVLPHLDITKEFTELQRDNLEWINRHAKTVKILHKDYSENCYEEQHQYMIGKSDFLIAVQIQNKHNIEIQNTIDIAKIKGIEIIIIDPLSYNIRTIKSRFYIK